MFVDNAVVEKNVDGNNEKSKNIKKETQTIKTLVGCIETAQQTIVLMQKESKRLMTKITKDRVNQLIQLH